MEQMEQSGLYWGDYLVMSSLECCGYEVIPLFMIQNTCGKPGICSSLPLFSKIQGVQNNLQPLIQLKVPLEIGLS